MRRGPEPQLWPPDAPTRPPVSKIGDLAADAGLRRVHVLAWRDLADVEAGGSELHAATLCRLWTEAGIDVTVRTSYAQGALPESIRDGYRVVRRAGRYLVFPRAAGSELLGRHGPRDGLVEIWNGVPFLSPLWARGPRVTFIHHVHTEMWPLVLPPHLARLGQVVERDLAPLLYRKTPVVTLSASGRRRLVGELGLTADLVHVVPPGIDDRFRPAEGAFDPDHDPASADDRDDEALVVAVGRLMPSKDFARLIRLVDRIREHRRVRLEIVGEGYERENLERLVRELDAESWCRLVGRVDDDRLVQLYQRAWVLASTSLSEGWGMTVTEAAACGTPAVATRVAGHLDAVDDGRTGLLFDTDAQALAALGRLLSDRAARRRLGEAAAERARAFTWERTAHDTLAVLAADAERRRRR